MKQYRLIIQPPALADLDEAYQWIHRQAPEAAARWFNRLLETLDTLRGGR
jgi:plasmid stabilization system protein ParE